jgi:phosphatidylcholine synthase
VNAAAWLVHLYTASGFVLAFLAAQSAIDHDFRTAFLYLFAQVLVDATDGLLARSSRVSERVPWFSGT